MQIVKYEKIFSLKESRKNAQNDKIVNVAASF
jgi:hypothetical protein